MFASNIRGVLLAATVGLISSGSALAQVHTSTHENIVSLPISPRPFEGKIGADIEHSTPAFPHGVTARPGSPNILLILTDDVGFAASTTFGGLIPTPNLDRLAAHGLKYNEFHTTAMCSPTRAALLTGRNHHAVSTGTIIDLSTGFPGYWSIIPKSAATIAEILKYNGYNTAFFGKHHNVPHSQSSSAGPFDLWPTGLGFEYFYGFIGGEVNQWNPVLYRDTARVDLSHKDASYILDRDLADDAIHWVHDQKAAAPAKPFFIYYAPGSAHSPHQAPSEWIKKFHGKFDQGWDKTREEIFQRQKSMGVIPQDATLTPRPAGLPAWDSLSPDRKRVDARLMEVYAAMLAYQDAEIGRILDELERMHQLDNTLVMFVEGDNGASAEGTVDGMTDSLAMQINQAQEDMGWLMQSMDQMGGPNTHEHYPAGWAWAMNTPFQWMKQVASHLGGTRNGLVISWPARIKKIGEVRTQFSHVTDIMPTILEAVGIKQPDIVDGVRQQRIDGTSLMYSFDAASEPSHHKTQYFEMLGNYGIYHDGWLANTTPKRTPWTFKMPAEKEHTEDDWELYDLRSDYSQGRDLALLQPSKLKELKALWIVEARKNNVLPIDNRFQSRMGAETRSHDVQELTYVYWGRDISLPTGVAPSFTGRSFSIAAQLDMPDTRGEGVIVATGGKFAGWSFFIKDGKPVAQEAFTQQPKDQFRIASTTSLPTGPVEVRYDFLYDGGGPGKGGTMRISINGREVAKGRVERTIRATGATEMFDTGRDTGDSVVSDYQNEGRFNGDILKIEITLKKPN